MPYILFLKTASKFKKVVKPPSPGKFHAVLFKEATGDLFTAAGVFIKNVHCPKGAAAVGLLGVDGRGRLSCHGCSRRIHDVRLKTEAQVVALVKADPKACLLLDRRNLSLS
jgi:hypothetical protein